MEIIPILLFIAPSWIVAILYYLLSMRPHLKSAQIAVLNKNLAKVDQFWSHSDGGFRPLSEDSIDRDLKKARRSFWLMTTFLSLLSVVGMLLLILAVISGHARLERNTLASVLAKDPNLSAAEIRDVIRELESLC